MLLQEIFANDDPADKCVPETQKKTFKMKKNKSDLIMAAAKGGLPLFYDQELFPGVFFMTTGIMELGYQNITSGFHIGICAMGMGIKLIINTDYLPHEKAPIYIA
jgi:hypothetical protein